MLRSLSSKTLAISIFGSALATAGCSVDSSLVFSSGGGGTGGGGTGGGATTDGTGGSTTDVGGGTTNTGGGGPGCGNGTLDAGEDCDGANLGGATCTDLGFSSPGGLACSAGCTFDASGCSATCDGAKKEPGEACDGADLGGETCADLGYVDPAGLACAGCQLDDAGCTASCGNGVTEPGETCDGADTPGMDCTSFGFSTAGNLGCSPDCANFDPSTCTATCNGTLEPGEPCDGADLGGADCTDFGYASPGGLTCASCVLSTTGCTAVCGNGTQEPGESCDDGNMTSGDGCSASCTTESPTGTSCQSAIPISIGFGTTSTSGTTVGGGAHAGATCTGDAPDRVYAITPTQTGYLTARLPRALTGYDSVLYISSACSDAADVTDRLCADSYDPSNASILFGGEVVSLPVQAGTTYYLFVDGYFAGDAGTYGLEIDLSNGRSCTDPVPITIEPGTPMTVLGTDSLAFPTTQGSCGGQPGDEVYYQITRTTSGSLGVDTDATYTNYNSVLYARTSCTTQSSEVACSNQGGNAMESLTLTMTANTPLFVVVDGSQAGGGNQFGNYGLTLTP
jgi:cysteine-rich repeat protein